MRITILLGAALLATTTLLAQGPFSKLADPTVDVRDVVWNPQVGQGSEYDITTHNSSKIHVTLAVVGKESLVDEGRPVQGEMRLLLVLGGETLGLDGQAGNIDAVESAAGESDQVGVPGPHHADAEKADVSQQVERRLDLKRC